MRRVGHPAQVAEPGRPLHRILRHAGAALGSRALGSRVTQLSGFRELSCQGSFIFWLCIWSFLVAGQSNEMGNCFENVSTNLARLSYVIHTEAEHRKGEARVQQAM